MAFSLMKTLKLNPSEMLVVFCFYLKLFRIEHGFFCLRTLSLVSVHIFIKLKLTLSALTIKFLHSEFSTAAIVTFLFFSEKNLVNEYFKYPLTMVSH